MTPRKSNLDVTGLRLVKKGCTVRNASGRSLGMVQKVSRGACLVKWLGWGYAAPADCNQLLVIL